MKPERTRKVVDNNLPRLGLVGYYQTIRAFLMAKATSGDRADPWNLPQVFAPDAARWEESIPLAYRAGLDWCIHWRFPKEFASRLRL